MIERQGNIWDMECNWLCITTNGIIRRDGRAVMGRGIALQAKQKVPDIDLVLAESLQSYGNVVRPLMRWKDTLLLSFPTKHDWKQPSNIQLIEQSARQLKVLFDNELKKPIIVLPRPGCSNGGLEWKDVRQILLPILVEDNFVVVCNDNTTIRQ